MQNFYEIANRVLDLDPQVVRSLVATFTVMTFTWILNMVIKKLVGRQINDDKLKFLWIKNLRYIVYFLAVFLIGRIWLEGFQSLATFLGLLSAGVAIALKDVVADFAAWLFLLWRKPFHIGDRIEIGNLRGDVIDKRVFKFTIIEIGNWVGADQSTGRVIHIPNHRVFLDSIANYTSGFSFIWDEVNVNLTFESDWKKGKKLADKIVQKHSIEVTPEIREQLSRTAEEYMIVYKHLTPTVYTSVTENGVQLSLRYLVHPRQRRGIAQAIWEDILTEFEHHADLQFAYTTIRYMDNARESKAALRQEMASGPDVSSAPARARRETLHPKSAQNQQD
jgi:small-conductance mechanosensitive channel